jgi:hypothetical protein
VQLYTVYDILCMCRVRGHGGRGGRGRRCGVVWLYGFNLYAPFYGRSVRGVTCVVHVCDDEKYACYTLHNPRQRAKLFLLPQAQLLERRLRRGRPAGRAPRPPAFPLRP